MCRRGRRATPAGAPCLRPAGHLSASPLMRSDRPRRRVQIWMICVPLPAASAPLSPAGAGSYGNSPDSLAQDMRGRFVSLCLPCRCVIRWICSVTAGRRAWLCFHSPVNERKRYPSDLSDERWASIEPVITAWKAAHRSVRGHQGGYETTTRTFGTVRAKRRSASSIAGYRGICPTSSPGRASQQSARIAGSGSSTSGLSV
jgi:hypothetical protein